MTSAKTNTDRRGFLTSLAAGASVAAVAVIPKSIAAPLDDSALVKLEEQIFEQYEQATAYDDEIIRLSNIWTEEMRRIPTMGTPKERSDAIMALPACIEHNRLCGLQEPFLRKMEALIAQMFATPAHTAEGRRAKATVLLGCVLGDEWRGRDEVTEYRELMARNLLLEFVGGEPGEMLRDQFA
jgi:hypothetical protein